MIKELLDKLADADRRKMMYAFENEIAHNQDLKDGRYLGVHQHLGEDCEIISKAGLWVVWRKK